MEPEFWKGFAWGCVVAGITALKGAAAVKSLWPRRARPRLGEAHVMYGYSSGLGTPVACRVDVNNHKGTKDCSVVGVEVRLGDKPVALGGTVHLSSPESSEITKVKSDGVGSAVPAGHAKRLQIVGRCPGMAVSTADRELPAEVAVKFNNEKTLRTSVTAHLRETIEYHSFP